MAIQSDWPLARLSSFSREYGTSQTTSWAQIASLSQPSSNHGIPAELTTSAEDSLDMVNSDNDEERRENERWQRMLDWLVGEHGMEADEESLQVIGRRAQGA